MRKEGRYCINPYIGFDDRLMMLIGIPLIAFFASLVFSSLPLPEFLQNFWPFFLSGVAFTMGYWFYNRFLIIILRKKFPDIHTTKKRNLLQLLFAFIGYPVVSLLVHGFLHLVRYMLGVPHAEEKGHLVGILTTYMLTFMILAIYEAVYFFLQTKKAIRDQERLHTEHVNSQLTNLRNQVNPHFLFNSINTLMSLIPKEAEDAHLFLSKLSKFYRYSVTERDALVVPLEKELGLLKVYIDLIEQRFGSALDVHIDLQPSLGEGLLPMSLQMLVENAVKHNIVSSDDPLRVDVYRENGQVVVENNIQHRITETASTGMGLKNIKERYALITKTDVEVVNDGKVFKVKIPIIH